MERVNISDIQFNDDYSYTYRGFPFTGIAIEHGRHNELLSEIAFVDGVKEGRTVEWYGGGVKRAESNYSRNTLHGEGMEWFESGQPRRRTVHELGVLIENDVWDEDGTLVSSYRLQEDDPNYNILQKLRAIRWKKSGA